jgi:hypothetical protein
MNKRILYVAILILFCSSCASVSYKTGQTPDDVYYSPAAGLIYFVPASDSNNYIADNEPYYPSYYYPGMFNPNYCNYTPYYNGYIYNNYYNPYYSPYPFYTKSYNIPYVNTTPRMVNLNAYSKNTYNNSNTPGSGFLLHPSNMNATTSGTNASGKIGTQHRIIVVPSFNTSNSYDNNNTPSYNTNNTPSYNNNNNTNNGDRQYHGGTDNSTGGFNRPARNGR